MLNKVSRKYAFSGLLILLVAGAVLFFAVRAFQTDSPLIDSKDASQAPNNAINNPDNLTVSDEAIPQEVIENSMAELNEKDQHNLQSFIDISRSGKDNDPRMDKELRNLSSELKTQLKNYYKNLAPEKRNERGLVSFLIAREIKSTEDLDFLQDVMSEEPCLSMQDCKVLTPRDPHFSSVDEVSLNYPQLVILYQLESRLNKDPKFLSQSSSEKGRVSSILAIAATSPVPKIRTKAEELQKKFSL